MTGTVLLIGLMLTAIASTPPPSAGQWPVDDPVVLSAFRPATPDWTAGHRGVDLQARTGTPVRAIVAGRIAFAGQIAGKPVVTVALPGGRSLRTTFEPVVATVVVGERVRAGQVIGTVAAHGGHCGGDAGCVHVGLRSVDGYLDPLKLITRRPAVLKPRSSAGASPRMRERERRAQALHGYVRVPLGGREGGMAEQLLNRAQVRTALEHMGRRGVPQAVRAEVGHPRLCRQSVHRGTNGPGVDPSAADADEQR